jgi:hypothetical protein
LRVGGGVTGLTEGARVTVFTTEHIPPEQIISPSQSLKVWHVSPAQWPGHEHRVTGFRVGGCVAGLAEGAGVTVFTTEHIPPEQIISPSQSSKVWHVSPAQWPGHEQIAETVER